MNAAHVHLAINHLPVIGIFFGLVALAAAALRGSEELKRLALLLLVVVGLFSLPAYFSGRSAEEIVEALPGVESDRIEEHEDAGLMAAIGAGLLGLVAAGALWVFRLPRRLPGWVVGTALVLALVVGGLMARTADLGGEIRHQEIRGEPGPSHS